MKTLKGVITATTLKGADIPVRSDLFVEPWYFILSTPPYSLEFTEAASATFNTDILLRNPPEGISAAGLTGMTFKARLINTVEYSEFTQPLSEAVGLTNMTFKARLINTVEYGEHRQPLSEATGLTDITFKASLINRVIEAEPHLDGVGGIFTTGVTLVPV